MRNSEQTIGNLIDKQNVSFIASISAIRCNKRNLFLVAL